MNMYVIKHYFNTEMLTSVSRFNLIVCKITIHHNLCCYVWLLNKITERIFVNCCFQESQVDAGEVQEKVKEVICKTITNIPLSEASSRERLSDAVS